MPRQFSGLMLGSVELFCLTAELQGFTAAAAAAVGIAAGEVCDAALPNQKHNKPRQAGRHTWPDIRTLSTDMPGDLTTREVRVGRAAARCKTLQRMAREGRAARFSGPKMTGLAGVVPFGSWACQRVRGCHNAV